MIHAEQANFPVTVMCDALEVSRSGYYAWVKKQQSNHKQEDKRLGVYSLKWVNTRPQLLILMLMFGNEKTGRLTRTQVEKLAIVVLDCLELIKWADQ